jgi:hypothetical protein
MIETRKREHSRKPDEQYDLIEACSPGPYLEMFARKAYDVLAQSPEILPGTFELADFTVDFEALDQLRPVFARIAALAGRASDTEMALGGDIGQEDAALRVTDKVRCWQLLQAVAHKLVQIPQLARGGFHRVDAPFQEVAAPCP